jgi:ribulose 1,5-bisphosphate synthetase/thiazole synthase
MGEKHISNVWYIPKHTPAQQQPIKMTNQFQASTARKTLESDVLIIGSGPIGAVYARTISDSDKNIRILMIEMGEQFVMP